MGERKGQNKYYPPDFDPQKHFNLDKYHGTHALRERAKKINQGILVIRFEMPYNIWCGGCGIHIAMGVRYNAEKSREGKYYSTPIWKFRMKCHLCDNYFEIKTDPANHDYVITSGARRKEQRWDPKDNEQIVTEDKNDIKKMATDAMFKLEHVANDQAKIKMSIPGISEITQLQKQKKDDYLLNSLARKKFRTERKFLQSEAAKDCNLLSKSSLAIELVKEHKDDVKMAQLMKYKAVQSYDEKQKHKRDEIIHRSLFEPTAASSSKKAISAASSTEMALQSTSSSSSSSSSSSISLISPKQIQQKEETKKKLQLVASRAKTADMNTFSCDKASIGGRKSGSGVDLGIVRRKNSITMCNEQVKSEIECLNKSGDNTNSHVLEGDMDSTVKNEIVIEDSPLISSDVKALGGLGSLLTNYDSNSSSGMESD